MSYIALSLTLGEHDVATNFDRATRVRVSRIHEHPRYNKDTLANDFSLLYLIEKVSRNMRKKDRWMIFLCAVFVINLYIK